ncbi:hypothetical protein [Sphingobacterium bovisgrunnientis]|jgi:hypothetical protein|uniref:hypothetical protein n=1 Tax=Sphingobacterium bovisgrunnientis TaxID=1874697 RepID=UPI00135CC33B|nr:hypothetical protein [Sphingobacterium bovisgrunnientis]
MHTNKLQYIRPDISFTLLEIECALSAGSARVLATDDNFFIHEDWVEEPTVERTIDW